MLGEMEVNMGFPYYISLGIGVAVHVVSFDWSFEFLQGEFG